MISFTLNGKATKVDTDPNTPLLFDLILLGGVGGDSFVVNDIIPDITKIITINGDGDLNLLDVSGLAGVKFDTGSSIMLDGRTVIEYSNIGTIKGLSTIPEPTILALIGLGYGRRKQLTTV